MDIIVGVVIVLILFGLICAVGDANEEGVLFFIAAFLIAGITAIVKLTTVIGTM